MKTSNKTRFAAAFAAFVCTLGMVLTIAGYAFPEAGADQVAARVVTARKS